MLRKLTTAALMAALAVTGLAVPAQAATPSPVKTVTVTLPVTRAHLLIFDGGGYVASQTSVSVPVTLTSSCVTNPKLTIVKYNRITVQVKVTATATVGMMCAQTIRVVNVQANVRVGTLRVVNDKGQLVRTTITRVMP